MDSSTNRTVGCPDMNTLPRGPNGRRLCRQCQQEVPKGRRTFCGDACVHQWKIRSSAAYAREQVWRRDRGVCASCGLDTEALADNYDDLRGYWTDDRGWKRRLPGGPRQAPGSYRRFLERIHALGYRVTLLDPAGNHVGHLDDDFWHADHIVPVCEGGGACGLDNLRTLCVPCHRRETAELARRRAAARRGGAVV